MSKKKTYQGLFKPNNPKKYKGDSNKIVYRSGWEKRVMKFLDDNDSILEWSSEEIIVPYISPKDGKMHRYFPDFVAKVQQADGKIKTIMIEVKPYKETIEPIKKDRITRQYLSEVVTYGINQAKWKAAIEFCSDRMWEFKIITEKELGIK